MGSEEMMPVARKLVDKAKTLLTELNSSDNYDEFTVYDEHGGIRKSFCEERKIKTIDNISATLKEVTEAEQTYIFGAVVMIEMDAEKKMKEGEGWNDPAAEDKRACVLLRELRDYIKKADLSKE